jgi:hypothetical protein
VNMNPNLSSSQLQRVFGPSSEPTPEVGFNSQSLATRDEPGGWVDRDVDPVLSSASESNVSSLSKVASQSTSQSAGPKPVKNIFKV